MNPETAEHAERAIAALNELKARALPNEEKNLNILSFELGWLTGTLAKLESANDFLRQHSIVKNPRPAP